MNYVLGRYKYLTSQPAFRETPLLLLFRTARWMVFCGVNHSPTFELDDKVRLKVDPVLSQGGSSSAYVLRHWAEPELRYLDHLVRSGGTFVDCGANIGIFTARAAGLVGAAGRVIAVEPGDKSHGRLKRNVELNKFTQVTLVKKAISDRKSIARLYHADGGPVSFSLVEKDGVDFEEVETTSIDDLVTEAATSGLDCIKLDVEGVELPALQGARQALARFHPSVIYEQTSFGSQRLGTTDEVSRLLLAEGYHLVRYTNPADGSGYVSPNIVAIHPTRSVRMPPEFIPWTPANA